MTVHGAYTGVIRDDLANVFHGERSRYPGIPADEFYRANMSRLQLVTNGSALTTAVMTSVLLYFEADEVVTSVTFLSGATAVGTPANAWAAVYNGATSAATLLGQSTDQPAITWAANTAKTFTLATPVTIPTAGWHRVGLMIKASQVPTLAGVTLENAAASAAVDSDDLILSATSGSALTDTAPATAGTLTAIAAVPYVVAR